MYFIGIDIGTTTICGIVLDLEENRIEAVTKINNDSWINSGNDWERIQDPEIIIKDSRVLLDRLLNQFKKIEGIGIAGQMHGILYIDKDGNSLSPLYTWLDGRGGLLFKDNRTYVNHINERTGLRIFTGYGLATHYYNLKNGLVPESAAYVSTITDYFAMKLCRKKAPVFDCSNAASLGLFNLDSMQFDYYALDKAKIDSRMLPEVVPSGTIIGELKNVCPVICTVGDNQASLLGSTKNIKESVNINIGTGGSVSVFSDKRTGIGGIETRPYFGEGYIQLGASLCGGRAYALLEKFFIDTVSLLTGKRINGAYGKMDAAGSLDYLSGDGLKVDTRFDGTRENQSIRGSIENISMDNFTPGELITGFQEGIAMELYGYYSLIRDTLGINPVYLIGSGNGIRKNRLIRSILEKKFGMPVRMTVYDEEAAAGAAITAAVGTGFINSFLETGKIINYQ